MDVYTDGARDNSVAGLGWKIEYDDVAVYGNKYFLKNLTSMETEYLALVEGIRLASQEDRGEINVYTDCKPLVTKMRYSDDNHEIWRSRRSGCRWLLNKFNDWSIEWISRSQNEDANRQAYEALEEGRQQK